MDTVLYFAYIYECPMKWQPKWLTPQAINHYFSISLKVHGIDRKLKGTPYAKKSNIRCGKKGFYWLYDMEYLVDVLGFKPTASIPERLIQN